MKCTKKAIAYLFSIHLAGGLILSPKFASAQGVTFNSNEDWDLNVTGQLPVFLVVSNHEEYSSDGDDQFATRVMSGFNPSIINFNIIAPDGLYPLQGNG